MAKRPALPPLSHTMVNSDTLSQEFCGILTLGDIFGDLVNCGPGIASAVITDGDPDTVTVCFDGAVTGSVTSGVTYTVNGGPPQSFTGGTLTGQCVDYGLNDPAVFGDTIRWQYTPGTLLVDGEPLSDQDRAVKNQVEDEPVSSVTTTLYEPQFDPVTGEADMSGLNGPGEWTTSIRDVWLADFEGIVRHIAPYAYGIQGARIVYNGISFNGVTNSQNLLIGWTQISDASRTSSTTWNSGSADKIRATSGLISGLTNATIVCQAQISVDANCTIRFRLGGVDFPGKAMIPADGVVTYTAKATVASFSASHFEITCSGTNVSVFTTNVQYEVVTGQANQNPSEYVPVLVTGSPYDGFSYFNRPNTKTVIDNVVQDNPPGPVFDPPPQGVNAPTITNKLLPSNGFDNNTFWDKNDLTLILNDGIDPTGKSEAVRMTSTNAGSSILVYNYARDSDTEINTESFFCKAGNTEWVFLQLAGYGATRQAYYHLSGNGSIGQTLNDPTAEIESLANGWYRVSIEVADADTVGGIVFLIMASADGSTTTQIGDTLQIYGSQLNEGPITPYVPTPEASYVTRPADQIQYPWGAEVFNGAEGSAYLEIVLPDTDTDDLSDFLANEFLLTDASLAGRVMYRGSDDGSIMRSSDGTDVATIDYTNIPAGQVIKIRADWSVTDGIFQIGIGSQWSLQENFAGFTTSIIRLFELAQFNGYLNKFRVADERLTPAGNEAQWP